MKRAMLQQVIRVNRGRVTEMKIGMLTSGGDCQSLNAAMRGVAKTLYNNSKDVEIYGFLDGYRGMISKNYKLMKEDDFSGILTEGGTILGTSRTPFKYINEPDEEGRDKIASMIKTYKELKLDCLVMLGGNGSHKTAALLSEKGLNVVTLPKTIDNDIEGTEMSFGFQSAIDVATRTIDEIHTTAASHSRVFIVEIMGHKTGWLTLHAGIAGGADIILIPEIPYNVDEIVKTIKMREKQGKKFTIIAMAEGAVSQEDIKLSKKELKEKKKTYVFPSVAYQLSNELQKIAGQEVRVTIPGHVQRGGIPSAGDRTLATRIGVMAAQLILKKEYGNMVCIKEGRFSKVPLEEVAGKTQMVDTDNELVRQAELLGISLGRKA